MSKRIFIAANLPLETKREISKVLVVLKKVGAGIHPVKSRRAEATKSLFNRVKWVKSENIHLTLHFLGQQKEEKIEEIKQVLEESVYKMKPVVLKIKGLDFFPNAVKPRIIFLACVEENNLINKLQARVGKKLTAIGIPVDQRPFKLHLTLGRINPVRRLQSESNSNSKFSKSLRSEPSNGVKKPEIQLSRVHPVKSRKAEATKSLFNRVKIPNLSFPVKSIELMESQLTASGSIYSVIETFPFRPC